MVSIPLPTKRYPTYEKRVALTEEVLRRVKALPGVEAAAMGKWRDAVRRPAVAVRD